MAESDTMSKVSKRNDAEFIQQINSNHQAASLRAESGIDADNAFYDTVEFSWRQFWESFTTFPVGL